MRTHEKRLFQAVWTGLILPIYGRERILFPLGSIEQLLTVIVPFFFWYPWLYTLQVLNSEIMILQIVCFTAVLVPTAGLFSTEKRL